MSLIELVFLGHSSPSPILEDEFKEFVRMARAWNFNHDVTGAILYGEDYFAQILEGDFYNIDKVCRKIKYYSPHKKLVQLDCRPMKLRSFHGYPALCISASQLAKRVPDLADDLKDFNPLEESRLLKVMREFSKFHFDFKSG